MNRKVKALLIGQGIKQIDIATALDLSKGTVSSVISGNRQSERVRIYVATLLNKDYAKLWGQPESSRTRKAA